MRSVGWMSASSPRHDRWGATTDESFRMFAAQRNLRRFVEKWHSGTLSERRPSSDYDYLRLESELKGAYIAELEAQLQEARRQLTEIAASRTWRLKRLLSRLVSPNRTE